MPNNKMIPASRKPPLARSPIRLRSRRLLQSAPNPIQITPPGSLNKASMVKKQRDMDELDLHPQYQTISCELRALAKKVNQEFCDTIDDDVGLANLSPPAATQSSLFQRGRFYEEYSARRTERLKRKKGEATEDKKQPSYNLGVKVESVKKREVKRFDSVRTIASSTPVTERRGEASVSRYSLRSTTGKENKKVTGVKASGLLRGIRKN